MSEETLLSNKTAPDESFDSQESSRVSSILIGILLIVAVFLAFNFFQGTPEENNTDENDVQATPVLSQDVISGEGSYTVQAGDTLWSIAESQLNDGFLWKEIAEANNISDSSDLEVGVVLIIPSVTSTTSDDELALEPTTEPTTVPTTVITAVITEVPTVVPTEEVVKPTVEPTLAPVESTGTPEETVLEPSVDQTYVVVRGDTLWEIAQKYYGDGNQWHRIFNFEENNVSMYTPQSGGSAYPLIHAGNVLVIPALVVATN